MKVILISSGKGGAGKTTTAVNLAKLYAQEHRVGLLDADVNTSNVPILMGMKRERMDVKNDRIIPNTFNENLKVVSDWFDVYEDTPHLLLGGDRAHRQIKAFCKSVEWDSIDYLIVDCPPGCSDEIYGLVQYLPCINGVVLVVQGNSEMSIADARAARNTFKHLNVPVLGYVKNMAYMEMGKERIELFQGSGNAAELGLKELASIPFKKNISPEDFTELKQRLEELL